MAEKADSTGNEKVHEALKLLEQVACEKKEEIGKLIADKYGNLREAMSQTESKVSQSLGVARDKISAAASQAREVGGERAREVGAVVDENVRRHPWPYIGGVAVGSLLLGYILGRKN